MKIITINSMNTAPIQVIDEDDKNIENYSSELSKLLESNNVSILHTTTCSVIIRPNIISNIVIEEKIEDTKPVKAIQKPSTKPVVKKKPVLEKSEHIDIITDGE